LPTFTHTFGLAITLRSDAWGSTSYNQQQQPHQSASTILASGCSASVSQDKLFVHVCATHFIWVFTEPKLSP